MKSLVFLFIFGTIIIQSNAQNIVRDLNTNPIGEMQWITGVLYPNTPYGPQVVTYGGYNYFQNYLDQELTWYNGPPPSSYNGKIPLSF